MFFANFNRIDRKLYARMCKIGIKFTIVMAILNLTGSMFTAKAFAVTPIPPEEFADAFLNIPVGETVLPSYDPTIPKFILSGFVTTSKSAPIDNVKMKILLSDGSDDFCYTDQDGFYSYDGVPDGYRVWFGPHPDNYGHLYYEEVVRVAPYLIDGIQPTADVVQNFTVQPKVNMDVDDSSSRPTFSGVIARSGGKTVLTWGGYSGDWATHWYPDDFGLPHTGVVYYSKPFHEFWPQNLGTDYEYDCRGSISSGFQPGVRIYENLNTPATYTWDSPGGTGWDKFPATPDNRLPNNPNVFVEADFPNFWQVVPKESIRLNGVHPVSDLSIANGHTAQFVYPIVGCSRSDYHVEILYSMGVSSSPHVWKPLNAFVASGTSNGDLSGDGLIGLPDVSEFAGTLGKCEPDPEFLVCADYKPDGCINLADLTVLTQIVNTTPAKTGGTVAQGEFWLEYDDEQGMSACVFQATSSWDVAIIRFEAQIENPNDLQWVPVEKFSERSILVHREDNDRVIFDVWVFGASLADPQILGFLSSNISKSKLAIDVLSTETVSRDFANTNTKGLPSSSFQLVGASPNPFNPATLITFSLVERARASLIIYDVSGRVIRSLIRDEIVDQGITEIQWNGRDDQGAPAAGGVYLYRLDVGDLSVTKRMTLIK